MFPCCQWGQNFPTPAAALQAQQKSQHVSYDTNSWYEAKLPTGELQLKHWQQTEEPVNCLLWGADWSLQGTGGITDLKGGRRTVSCGSRSVSGYGGGAGSGRTRGLMVPLSVKGLGRYLRPTENFPLIPPEAVHHNLINTLSSHPVSFLMVWIPPPENNQALAPASKDCF